MVKLNPALGLLHFITGSVWTIEEREFFLVHKVFKNFQRIEIIPQLHFPARLKTIMIQTKIIIEKGVMASKSNPNLFL